MKGMIQILFFVFGMFTQLGDAKALDNKLPSRQFPLASSSDYTFAGENAGDYAGYWVSSAGDIDGDGLADVLVGAYDNDEGGASAGAAYLILGKNLGKHRRKNLSQADYKFVGEAGGDWAGIQVSSAGDVDGDGLDDLLIGAYGAKDKGPKTGTVYLILGKSLGAAKTVDLSQADYKFIGENADDYAGYAVSMAGDVDGDKLGDFIIGASGQDSTGKNAGAVYIILGSSLGAKKVRSLLRADYKFTGEQAGDWAGYLISGGGDVDGDGLGDIIIGANGNEGGKEAHASYVVLGKSLGAKGVYSLAKVDYKLIGEERYDYASQVSLSGDVDGDGLDDLLIGAAGNDSGGSASGAAYVVLGKSLRKTSLIDLSQADYKFIGEKKGDNAGAHVAHAGDIDGDGCDDLLIGALRYQGRHKLEGAVYVILGKSIKGRSIDLSQANLKFIGGSPEQYVGHAVFSAGDVDGDKLDDFLIGAWSGPDWKGAAYLVTGASVRKRKGSIR